MYMRFIDVLWILDYEWIKKFECPSRSLNCITNDRVKFDPLPMVLKRWPTLRLRTWAVLILVAAEESQYLCQQHICDFWAKLVLGHHHQLNEEHKLARKCSCQARCHLCINMQNDRTEWITLLVWRKYILGICIIWEIIRPCSYCYTIASNREWVIIVAAYFDRLW